MRIKRLVALSLICAFVSCSAVYAGDFGGSRSIITENLDAQNESIAPDVDTAPAEPAVGTPSAEAVPEAFEISDEEPAPEIAEAEAAAEIPDDAYSDEELVGAVTYRSIYEPCFADALYRNRDALYGNRNDYTLLDLDYDGIKELIVNVVYNKHARIYFIYTINPTTYKATFLGEVGNDSFEPIATNGSRIAFVEQYKGHLGFYSSPFSGNEDGRYTKTLYDGSYTYSSEYAALVDLSRKKFAANAVISPGFIDISDLTLLNSAGNVSRFSDVVPHSTAHAKEVYWALAKGITKGYSGTTLFGINDTCTRGEAAMFLWRLAGKPSPKSVSGSPFSDVPNDHSFYKAILWAYQKGITKGYSNGTFGINDKCTRGQIATFIWRYKESPKPKSTKSSFSDTLTPAYRTAIIWAAENGITKGYSDNTFRDKRNCTRGEIVTFLYRVK